MNQQMTNVLIMTALQKKEPTLNLNGADHKLLKMCITDFWDYVGYLQRGSLKLEEDKPQQPRMVFINIIGGKAQVTVNDPVAKEVAEFIEGWVGLWWKKYLQRIKLTFEDKPIDKLGVAGAAIMKRNFNDAEQREILMHITDSFIKWGELCCPKILAQSLFRRVLGRTQRKKWTVGNKINFLSALRGEAKRVAYVHGPLIFIRPDKSFYRLREYRDSGRGPIV